MNYTELSTVDLRRLVRERGLAKGAAVASAKKEDLISLLDGTRTGLDSPVLASSAIANGDTLADAIAKAINGKVNGFDEQAARGLASEIVDDAISEFEKTRIPQLLAGVQSTVRTTTIALPELGAPVDMGAEPLHFQFAQVLSWVRSNVPVWLWGQPGGGKTHLGRQIAKAMDLPAYVMSIDETVTANKLLGFQNLVSGAFVEGWLYQPYKNGGLVVIDEIDTGNPGIIAGLNALLANSHYMFPNGETVERHARFRVIACANTKGTGAVAGFTARQRLDAATLNRFAIIEFKYDEGLELQLVCGIPSKTAPWTCDGVAARPEQLEAWVRWVHAARREVGASVLISPRASILGGKALLAGIPPKEVAEALVFGLVSDDTKNRILRACGSVR
jgi:hypothetical protein